MRLPRPHSGGQREILACDARFRIVANGRRWGKTVLDMVLAAQGTIRDRRPVGWFAPNYKYLGEPYLELKRRLAPIITAFNHERFLEIGGSLRIDFWTLEDPDAGRSRKYGRAIIDEAGMVADLGQTFENAIRPTLVDYSGDVVMTGTPKGANFFRTMWQRGIDGVPGYASFQMPTSTNPFLSPTEYDRERLLNEGLPERSYRQEFLAEFIDDAGGVFIGVDDVVCHGVTSAAKVLPARGIKGGLDLAQTTDWTVLALFDQDGKQVYFDRFQRLTWPAITDRVANAILAHGATVYMDATGVGKPVYDELKARKCRVVPFIFTAQSKAALIENAAACIQRKGIELLDIPVQIAELKAYEYQISRSGSVKMSAPEGLHDDCVIAIALAIRALERPRLEVF